MSRKSPDIRLPCGETAATVNIPTLGGCFQQWNPRNVSGSNNPLYIKHNVTKMLASADGTSWVSPETTIELPQYLPGCDQYSSNSFPIYYCGDGVNGNKWCFLNIDDSYVQSCDTGSFTVGNFHNCYSQSNETSSIICREIGFKNVYASKMWQGVFGMTSNVWQKATDWDWCCDGCGYRAPDNSVDKTKYRTITAWATFDSENVSFPGCTATGDPYECCTCLDANCDPCNCGDEGCISCGSTGPGACSCQCYTCPPGVPCYYGGAASATSTVDIYGNQYNSCASSSYGAGSVCYGGCHDGGYPCYGDPDCEAACDDAKSAQLSAYVFGLLGAANSNWTSLIGTFGSIVNGSPCGIGGMGSPTRATQPGGPGTWHLEWDSTYECFCYDGCGCCTDDPPGPHTWVQSVVDITPTTLEIWRYAVTIPAYTWGEDYCSDDGYCRSIFLANHKKWSYGATSFQYNEEDANNYYAPNGGYANTVIHADLSNPYTTDDVYDSIVTLLGKWDMGDPNVLPWRQDSAKTQGPWVHYDEVANGPYIGACESVTGSTGAVLGAPGPEGIDTIWDFAHKNQCVCSYDCGGETGYTFYDETYGAWSPGAFPRATSWVDTRTSLNLMDGAFCGDGLMWTMPHHNCSAPDAGRVVGQQMWACKYAEVIFPKQSMNYARPCGKDRLVISESTARCWTGSIDTQLILSDAGAPCTIPSGQWMWVCGGGLDGIWTGSVSGYSITLNEPRIASASLFPTVAIDNCGSGMVGQLKYPSVNLCGRVDITAVHSASITSSVTCSLMEPTYLVNGDTVTVVGATGTPSMNSTFTIGVIDNQTITLNGFYGGGDYHNGAIYNPYGKDWKWNDISTKNDFQIRKWYYNYRDIGEYYAASASYQWNSGLYRACCPPFLSPPDCNNYPTCPPDCDCPRPTIPAYPRGAMTTVCGQDENVTTMSCETGQVCPTPCKPLVAYFSPNVGSESFMRSGSNIISAINYGFHNPGMDSMYGTLWQGIPVQTMDDPIYVAPPCPCQAVVDPNTFETTYECDPDTSWVMDNGSCQSDVSADPEIGIHGYAYYPRVPFFEARCTVPDGSPSLGTGVKIGCTTNTDPTCVTHDVCWAPYAPHDFSDGDCCNCSYKVYIYENPWDLLVTEEGCVCAQGRFAAEYQLNGVGDGPSCDYFAPP